MKPAAFRVPRARVDRGRVGLLAEHGDEAKPLAGGQSLVPMLALRLARFEHVVDLKPGAGARRHRAGRRTSRSGR